MLKVLCTAGSASRLVSDLNIKVIDPRLDFTCWSRIFLFRASSWHKILFQLSIQRTSRASLFPMTTFAVKWWTFASIRNWTLECEVWTNDTTADRHSDLLHHISCRNSTSKLAAFSDREEPRRKMCRILNMIERNKVACRITSRLMLRIIF